MLRSQQSRLDGTLLKPNTSWPPLTAAHNTERGCFAQKLVLLVIRCVLQHDSADGRGGGTWSQDSDDCGGRPPILSLTTNPSKSAGTRIYCRPTIAWERQYFKASWDPHLLLCFCTYPSHGSEKSADLLANIVLDAKNTTHRLVVRSLSGSSNAIFAFGG